MKAGNIMKKLLMKNLILNKKNILVGLLLSILFSSILIDGNKYYPAALLMSPSLLFSCVVGKMCYIESSEGTKSFLQALPINRKQIICEKNIVAFLTILLGILIVNLMGLIINQILNTSFQVSISLILLMAGFLVVYNTVFIFLNYKFDYSKTQLTPYIVLLAMFVLFKYGKDILLLDTLSWFPKLIFGFSVIFNIMILKLADNA